MEANPICRYFNNLEHRDQCIKLFFFFFSCFILSFTVGEIQHNLIVAVMGIACFFSVFFFFFFVFNENGGWFLFVLRNYYYLFYACFSVTRFVFNRAFSVFICFQLDRFNQEEILIISFNLEFEVIVAHWGNTL